MPVFLGLDLSTQSLTALAIDTGGGAVVLDRSLRFGDALPQYGSPDGFLPSGDPDVRHADPRIGRLYPQAESGGKSPDRERFRQGWRIGYDFILTLRPAWPFRRF